MEYAKLTNGFPSYASNSIIHDGVWYGNPPKEIYLAEGYKPIILYDEPEKLGVGWLEEVWTEDDQNIYRSLVWREAGSDDEIASDQALDILFGGDPA